MQNFAFLPDGSIFWTSASNDLKDRWQSFLHQIGKGPKPKEYAHTSLGKRIEGHGQWLLFEGNRIVVDKGYYRIEYDLELNELSRSQNGKYLIPNEIKNLPGAPDKNPQGIEYTEDASFAVYGDAGTSAAILKHDRTQELIWSKDINFKKKWYHRNDFEVEGIRAHPDTGELWIGWTVSTWWLTRNNYIVKV